MIIQKVSNPLLELRAFVTEYRANLSKLVSPTSLHSFLSLDAPAPISATNAIRDAIRALLRHGGFKPAGRSKPASEYLVKAAKDGRLQSINVAVDACNVVSLHSGLPISVVDLDRAKEPFRVAIAEAGASYVFNTSGQEIDLKGLLCLLDADGPCANAVKDSQRTKTNDSTRRTLSLIWGHRDLRDHIAAAEIWYRELLADCGAATESVEIRENG